MKFAQVTIKDIARELGISPSTVSRALKDHPDISVDTKKAVNALADKLNYQPNIVALNLRQKKTNTIGVIIPEVVHFFFSTVISGIEDVAYSAGYNVILAQSNESYAREVAHVKALFNSRVDGMLLSLSRETTNYDHVESIISKGVPIVFYDRMYHSPTSSKVIVDDYAGAKEATNHLISQGCKNIVHMVGAPNLVISIDRLRGYKDALKENKMEVRDEYIIACDSGTFEEGKKITEKLLASKLKVDGIFANNDPMAMGAMVAIKEKGIKIPDDIAIIGFSNWFIGELMEPSLSTIDQPGFEMGQEAARLLIRQIELKVKDQYEPVEEIKILRTRLIVRDSSLKKQPKKK
jgi:LacI family transcriptional regulator